ncbi:MAG: hypothetical protein MJ080_03965 [Clostridia bacterium]|nr:hypothetical protein [Clostridia bacterium]
MVKKLCGIFLVLIISFNCFAIVSFADQNNTPSLYEGSMRVCMDFEDSLANPENFYNDLLSEFKKCTTEINISKYNIPVGSFDALDTYVKFSFPEAFNINIGYRLGYREKSGIISSIFPTYHCDKSTYDSMFDTFEAKAEKFLEGVKNNNNLADYQKALILHDRIVANCDYDGTDPHSSDAYGALVDGKAVCQGYAFAYMYLLSRVGITSYQCASDSLEHVWNILLIDGEYYHVDTTWDDPTNLPTGAVEHTYFLVSTDKLREGHDAYDYDEAPVSKRFDNYFWQDCESQIILTGGNIYYIELSTGNFKKMAPDGTCEVITVISDFWTIDDEGYYYPGCFSKLSTDGTNLFYSTTDKVFKYDPQNAALFEVFDFSYDAEEDIHNGLWVYGFTYKDDYIYYEIAEKPFYEKGDTKTVKRSEYQDISCAIGRVGGELCYLIDGEIYRGFYGAVMFGGVTYLVMDGYVDCSEDAIIPLYYDLFHVKNGIIQTNEAPSLHRFDGDGILYYFENGRYIQKTLIFNQNGTRYFVYYGWVDESEGSWVVTLKNSYFVTEGIVDEDEFYFLMGETEYYTKNGIITYSLRKDAAETLTYLVSVLIGSEEEDYLCDFNRDENLNILDLVYAKKELAN